MIKRDVPRSKGRHILWDGFVEWWATPYPYVVLGVYGLATFVSWLVWG
jgi:hypothetical protein